MIIFSTEAHFFKKPRIYFSQLQKAKISFYWKIVHEYVFTFKYFLSMYWNFEFS